MNSRPARRYLYCVNSLIVARLRPTRALLSPLLAVAAVGQILLGIERIAFWGGAPGHVGQAQIFKADGHASAFDGLDHEVIGDAVSDGGAQPAIFGVRGSDLFFSFCAAFRTFVLACQLDLQIGPLFLAAEEFGFLGHGKIIDPAGVIGDRVDYPRSAPNT